jgi:transcriptional regulator with XRE-family HTH domain
MKTFGQFLREQIDQRRMSNTEFAKLVGVSPNTINAYLKHDHSKTTYYGKRKVAHPELEFIEKLSIATHTDAGYLVRLVIPNAYFSSTIEPYTVAAELDGLSEEDKEFIQAAIQGIKTKRSRQDTDK